MNEKLKQLKQGKWSDKYFCKLALLDHLRECLEKDNHLKAIDAPKDSDGYKALDKELIDLRIILELYMEGKEDLFEARLDKFLANLS